MNEIVCENKIDKSIRNSEAFQDTLARAINGGYDLDISEKPQQLGRLPLLKIHEQFSIRKGFSLETGQDFYKLMKEVFYTENPGSNYFETVDPFIYRRVASQKETGDLTWAKNVAKHYGISVATFEGAEVKEDKKAAKKAPKATAKRGRGRPRKNA